MILVVLAPDTLQAASTSLTSTPLVVLYTASVQELCPFMPRATVNSSLHVSRTQYLYNYESGHCKQRMSKESATIAHHKVVARTLTVCVSKNTISGSLNLIWTMSSGSIATTLTPWFCTMFITSGCQSGCS